MCFRSILSRVACSFVLVTVFSAFVFADTIRLKDGSIIKGHITSFSGGKFNVDVGEGSRLRQLTFLASEIESITFDASNVQTTKPTPVPASYNKPEQNQVSPPKVIVTDNISPAQKTAQAQPKPQMQSSPQTQPQPQSGSPAPRATMPPIAFNIKVLADNTANGWTNSGWVVRKGQRIRISGDGSISLGKGQNCSPSGIAELADDQKLLKSVPTGALLAVIGDDNNDFIYIGAEREFTAARDGMLFLGINEGNLNDNSGSFNARIEIIKDGGN